jgi:hypothetical protein
LHDSHSPIEELLVVNISHSLHPTALLITTKAEQVGRETGLKEPFLLAASTGRHRYWQNAPAHVPGGVVLSSYLASLATGRACIQPALLKDTLP